MGLYPHSRIMSIKNLISQMKKYIILILALWLADGLMAQQLKVGGTLVDEQTGEAVAFANIALYTPTDTVLECGAASDLDGHFVLRNVGAGSHLLRITMVGYQVWEQPIACSGDTLIGTIALTQGVTLATVQITADRPLFSIDGEKNIYSTADDPSIQNGTVVDALQNAPGIEVDAEGNVRLRGVQSVDIWINGHASHMNPEALKQYLKTLPANALKRIEVITNPSARYGGGNPVVNIVTKSKTIENQFISVGLNGNSKPEFSPWLSYVFSDEHWEADVYANMAYQSDKTSSAGSDALLTATGDTSRTDSFIGRHRERSIAAAVSADAAYRFDSLNTLYLWGAVFPTWSRWADSNSTTRQERLAAPGDYSFDEYSEKAFGRPSLNIEDGIWFEHLIDESTGHTIMMGYYGSFGLRDSLINTSRSYPYQPSRNMALRKHYKGEEWFHAFEAAYILPFGSQDTATGTLANEFETGLEGFYIKESATTAADSLIADGYAPCRWLSSEIQSQTLDAALYANYTRRWGRLTLKAGLRGGLQTGLFAYPDAPEHNFRYLTPTFVPSIHLTYRTAHSTFGLSYTRRMMAPEGSSYSTRRFYSLDSYRVGNPLLQVGSSHHIEAKWDMYRDRLGSVGVNLFYAAQTNQQGELTDVAYDDQFFHRLVTFSQPINIGNSWNSGADIHLVYRPNAFVNIRFNGSIFYDYLDIRFRPDDEPYRNGMLCYALRLNAWVKLWNKVQLFGNIYYSSPTQRMLFTSHSRKGIDLGVSADFFHRLLNLNLCVNDIFGWNKRGSSSNNPYLPLDTEISVQSRYISLGITFRFGEMELEKESHPTSRRGGSHEQ